MVLAHVVLEVAKMRVRPMSPSANFTTYNLPPPSSSPPSPKHALDAFGHHSYVLPRSKTSGLLRFLRCSRPCFHRHSVHVDDDDDGVDLDEDHTDEEWAELQAVMRHLEVRWQLFDEALSRFGDLEAMLAICADKVHWRYRGAKEAHGAEDLIKSLISRKLSMEVHINRITQLSPSGELGTSFTRDGSCGHLAPKERAQVQAELDSFREEEHNWLRSARRRVLEEDNYVLCNQRGEVVEEGTQLVIWEQYNATWYIRGCISNLS